jgi:hypothetical protein
VASKKQLLITSDLIERTLNGLRELDIPFAVVIEGTDYIFTNVSKRHAVIILKDAVELADKIREKQLDELADKLADRNLNPD